MSPHNIEDFKPLSVSPNFGVLARPKREKGVTQNPDGHASKGDEKHERTVQRRVCGFGQRTNCGWVHSPPGMAAAYEPTPKGALALHLTGPLGKGRCDTVV